MFGPPKCLLLPFYSAFIVAILSIKYSFPQQNDDGQVEPAQTIVAKEHREIINIGFVLNPKNFKDLRDANSSLLKQIVLEHLDQINEENAKNDPSSPEIRLVTSTIVEHPIEMSKIVCEQLIGYSNTKDDDINKPKHRGGVSAVIVDTDDEYTASIASISFTLGLYNIPIIGTTLRDSSLFNKNLHSSYISLIPPHSHQADVWYNLMVKFQFEQAFVLTNSDNRDLLSRFVDLIAQQSMMRTSDKKFKIEAVIEYDESSHNDLESVKSYIVERISKLLENSICRVFLIHAQSSSEVQFFVDIIHHLNMTDQGFALIVSEDFLQVAHKNNISLPSGIMSSQLSPGNQVMPDYQAYTLDALNIVTKGIMAIKSANIDAFNDVPHSCKLEPTVEWFTGIELYYSILKQTFLGNTGFISFDENGDRLTANYKLLNLVNDEQSSEDQSNQVLRTIGMFKNGPRSFYKRLNPYDNPESHSKGHIETQIDIDVSLLEWPGKIKGQIISGVFVSRHLRIITLQEKPFVWVLDSKECWNQTTSKTPSENTTKFVSIPCLSIDPSSGVHQQFCCEGYCMDLLKEISKQLNFTFDLYLADDNQYGSIEPESKESQLLVNNSLDTPTTSNQQQQPPLKQQQPQQRLHHQHLLQSSKGYDMAGETQIDSRLKWTGLMGELVSRRVDMAFAPLTITPQRAQAVDFSKPFKFHGFSIILRRASKHTTLASFLQPFHNQLWILVIGVATHVVALSLYLLDRYSTFGRFGMKRHFIPKTPRLSHDDNPLHLSNSLWFSWSILLNSGVGEHTPKSLSGRVLGIFWSGFAMIVVASYTANLAAFLVLDSREETPTLSGIDDPRLRSGDLAFNFATVKGSAVDAYLQSQVEYINLYRKMEEFNFGNVDESILALRTGAIDALIWDSTRLEWEVANDEKCSLGIAGELFGSSGYGIGLQKNSYWTKNVTTKLLELHECGFMIDLDKKWIADTATTSQQQQQHSAKNCERRNEDYPETLGIFNIAGVFILFACGLVTSFGLIAVERFCYKHRGALLERQRRWWRRDKVAR